MGLGRLEIGRLQINLFRGRVALDELALYRSAAQVLYLEHGALDLSVLALMDRHIQLQSVTLEGLSVTVQERDGVLQVAGYAVADDGAAPSPEVTQAEPSTWGFGLDEFIIRDAELQVIHPQFTEAVRLEDITIGALATWRADYITPLRMQLGLREGSVLFNATATLFANEPRYQAALEVQALPLAAFAGLAAPAIAALDGKLTTQMSVEVGLHATQGMRLQQEGELTLTGLLLQQGDTRLQQDGLHWKGSLVWGDIADSGTLQLQGTLTLDGITLRDKSVSAPAIALQGLAVSGIQLTGLDDLSIDGVAVEGVTLAVRRSNNGVALSGLPLATKAGETPAPAEATEVPPTTEAAPFKLRLARLGMSGENRISFADATVNPPFHQEVVITSAELRNIDTTLPEQPSSLVLHGKDNGYARFSVEGEVSPLAPDLSLDLKARVSDLDLPPVSPYLAQLLGYRITTGQLESSVKMKIRQQTMDGEVGLRLNQLKLEEEDPARIENFQGKMTMPLNTALSLLRDSDDNIRLKLPVSGRLDDPQFELADIINTALGKSLKMASVSYLKHLLQPYGSLISVVQMAGKAAGKIQLEPIHFTAGSAELPADSAPYLERLGKLLEKRSLNLQLCGFATTADLAVISKGKEKAIPPAGHPVLESLAKGRADGIKALLVNSYGALPKQLFICHPSIDSDEGATARVEFSL